MPLKNNRNEVQKFSEEKINKRIRLFVAADIQTSVNFKDVQKTLHSQLASFRPVSMPHMTLYFIGDVDETSVDLLKQTLEKTVHQAQLSEQNKAGVIKNGGTLLGGHNAITVIALDVDITHEMKNFIENLRSNFQSIMKILKKEKTQKDFSFLPHITLGRAKRTAVSPEILSDLKAPEERSFTLETITLYRSEPGSIYTPLISCALKKDLNGSPF